jgi:hypothetical protein
MPNAKAIIASTWTDPQSYATTLVALGLHDFGTEIFDLEPETIEEELRHRYGVTIPPVNRDKLFALLVALSTDQFYQSVTAFMHISNALNNSRIDFDTFDPVTPEEMAWATTEVTLNDPPEKDEELASRYTADVRRFIGGILDASGFIMPPKYLRAIADMQVVKDTILPDDPALLQTQTINQSDRSRENEAYVKENLTKLVEQLQVIKPVIAPNDNESSSKGN